MINLTQLLNQVLRAQIHCPVCQFPRTGGKDPQGDHWLYCKVCDQHESDKLVTPKNEEKQNGTGK